MNRKLFVASAAALLAGCDSTKNALNENQGVKDVLHLAQGWNHAAIGTHGMAKLYAESDIDRNYPTNGDPTPTDPEYQGLVKERFRSYKLAVSGLVERPQTFDLARLRTLASLTQITRHDCVEGWSVVGKWTGIPLHAFLSLVRPKPEARYVVFYSFDRDENLQQFYGSIDVRQAAHPQTMLALDLNGAPVDPDHGGPVRLRIPTQLAYKSTKWVQRIELVDSFKRIYGGHGGYWEDQGYEWYAGI
ncbi:MAG: molybdopterin-dependent oxidoreductase [Candidatus Eremiobacteraeota bacterium]|nr:molybdopterin-dependent oxidoreductase [Candidatus Eremiobacteraeota bacterium]